MDEWSARRGWKSRLITGGDFVRDLKFVYTHPSGVTLTAYPYEIWQTYSRGEPLENIFMLDKGLNRSGSDNISKEENTWQTTS